MTNCEQSLKIAGITALLGLATAASDATPRDVDYLRQIKPLLAEKCAACHGALKQNAGLRLDVGRFILKGSDEGPVVESGSPHASRLIERVSSDDVALRMPPHGEGEPLDAQQVALLSAWIEGGAPVPDDEPIPADPRDHWAFQTPQRPPVPDVDDSEISNPIDAFIVTQQRRLGVAPVGRADSSTLWRRAYFDLVGLPPAIEAQHSFANDGLTHAWEKLVDDLLASPHYGERWARHWMDVWRYSDWDGYQEELRSSQRHIWRWRDWIIQSLNADKGYDRMIVEMLAGDELAPGNFEILPATGFLARNYHNSNRDIWLTATVEHASKAFLGITLSCARCHDHKYDPIPQQEYYRFRAIFEPHHVRTEHIPGEPDLLRDGLPVALDADPDAATFVYLRGDEKLPLKDSPVDPSVPEALGGALEIEPVVLPVESYFPALRPFVREQQLAAAHKQLANAQTALADAEAEAFARQQSTGDDAASNADIVLLRHNRDVARASALSLEARQAADCAKHCRGGEAPDQADIEALSQKAAEAERRYEVAVASRDVYEKQACTIQCRGSQRNRARQPKSNDRCRAVTAR